MSEVFLHLSAEDRVDALAALDRRLSFPEPAADDPAPLIAGRASRA